MKNINVVSILTTLLKIIGASLGVGLVGFYLWLVYSIHRYTIDKGMQRPLIDSFREAFMGILVYGSLFVHELTYGRTNTGPAAYNSL